MHSPKPPRPPCPPCPSPPQGYLIQRIIACEKRSVPCLHAQWCFDICNSACIQRVTPNAPPAWTIENNCLLRITIPVSVQLCDSCGHCDWKSASIELETQLPRHMACELSDPHVTLFLLPCVRLLRAVQGCGGCYHVELAISLDLYLLRYEALRGPSPKPPCPQLPLYPPPMC